MAYRICTNGVLNEMRDDDGESGAGDKLLDLLRRMGVENAAVVVTRWYGGTQLGPDRFRDINHSARLVIDQWMEQLPAARGSASSTKKFRNAADVYFRIVNDPAINIDDFTAVVSKKGKEVEIPLKDFDQAWKSLQGIRMKGRVTWELASKTDVLN
eukprot:CAMPEP_0177684774 /NCGR_PEP_ID=MMETSP0447-20121125/32613_1 /TAXON_ID=0 /ORGANISM="Stygamoeba regulata, Strain BSH-02190019" /LENGTH=155 /DNA_ID=CAMNT_0019194649 /DNA_START=238 /DNA_END=705 /DNA_ORIENTATION=-